MLTWLEGRPHGMTGRRTSGREGTAARRTRTVSARSRCLSVSRSVDVPRQTGHANSRARLRRRLGACCTPAQQREGQPTAASTAQLKGSKDVRISPTKQLQTASRMHARRVAKAGAQQRREGATTHVQRAPYSLLLIPGMM
jgi:hypothetical protein